MISQSKKPIFCKPSDRRRIERSKPKETQEITHWVALALVLATLIFCGGFMVGIAHAEPLTMYVNTESGPLNVRERPSIHAEITAKLERGESVTVVSTENGWALIDGVSEAGQGWASLKYLSEEPLEPPELPERFLEVEED